MLGFYQTVFQGSYWNIDAIVSNFWLVILQRQGRIKNRVRRLWWSFSGENEGWFLIVKKFYGSSTLS